MNPPKPYVLTQRQANEKAHYDEAYSQGIYESNFKKGPDGTWSFPPANEAFEVVAGEKTRPYNQDWEYLQGLRSLDLRGKVVLEVGCGAGTYTAILAFLGAEVHALDLSEAAIEVARARARSYGLEDRITFYNLPAEGAEFPDGYFDVVCGAYILHHIEISEVARILQRILKPGGRASFLEWLEWTPFDMVRQNKFLHKLFPTGDGDATDDERKMNDADFDVLRRAFRSVQVTRFYTFARLHYFVPKLFTALTKLDYWCYKSIPGFRQTGGAAIITLEK